MRETLPSVNVAYVVLIQEENHRGISNNNMLASSADGATFYSNNLQNNPPNKTNWNLVCDFCKAKCHDYDQCFKRIEYHPGWKFKPKPSKTNNVIKISPVINPVYYGVTTPAWAPSGCCTPNNDVCGNKPNKREPGENCSAAEQGVFHC